MFPNTGGAGHSQAKIGNELLQEEMSQESCHTECQWLLCDTSFTPLYKLYVKLGDTS